MVELAAAVDEAKQRLIVGHVALIGLTPFIPIPFVDNVVKARIQRRLVRRLTQAYGVDLSPADVIALADDASGSWGGRALGLALVPAKKVFKKAFLVLGVKGVVDVTSIAWHRAFLLDHALSTGCLSGPGAATAPRVRAAIDAVCKEVPVTPVAPALRAAFEGSRAAVARIGALLSRAVGNADEAARVDEAIDASASEAANGRLVDRVRRAVNAVPEEHRARLRAAFARHLAATGS